MASSTRNVAGAAVAAQAAKAAGAKAGEQLQTMVAIACAETGGKLNPTAHCLNCAGVKEDSRGLWQINVDAHPEYANANLYDPATCAAAAWAISKQGTDWSPWSTYADLDYVTYWGLAAQGAKQAGISTGSAAVPGSTQGPTTVEKIADAVPASVANPLASVSTFLNDLMDPSKWLVRAVYVAGGMAGLIVGAVMLDHDLVTRAASAVGVPAAASVAGDVAKAAVLA